MSTFAVTCQLRLRMTVCQSQHESDVVSRPSGGPSDGDCQWLPVAVSSCSRAGARLSAAVSDDGRCQREPAGGCLVAGWSESIDRGGAGCVSCSLSLISISPPSPSATSQTAVQTPWREWDDTSQYRQPGQPEPTAAYLRYQNVAWEYAECLTVTSYKVMWWTRA